MLKRRKIFSFFFFKQVNVAARKRSFTNYSRDYFRWWKNCGKFCDKNLKIDPLFISISCITLSSFLIFRFLFNCSYISESLQKVKYETNTTAVQNSLAGILRNFFVVSKIHLSQSTFLISKPDFTK